MACKFATSGLLILLDCLRIISFIGFLDLA